MYGRRIQTALLALMIDLLLETIALTLLILGELLIDRS
jgi:hypothetical protein